MGGQRHTSALHIQIAPPTPPLTPSSPHQSGTLRGCQLTPTPPLHNLPLPSACPFVTKRPSLHIFIPSDVFSRTSHPTQGNSPLTRTPLKS